MNFYINCEVRGAVFKVSERALRQFKIKINNKDVVKLITNDMDGLLPNINSENAHLYVKELATILEFNRRG